MLVIAWKVSKYGVYSSPYFPYSVRIQENTNAKKTPYLDTFHAVNANLQVNEKNSFTHLPSCILPWSSQNASWLLLPKRLWKYVSLISFWKYKRKNFVTCNIGIYDLSSGPHIPVLRFRQLLLRNGKSSNKCLLWNERTQRLGSRLQQ